MVVLALYTAYAMNVIINKTIMPTTMPRAAASGSRGTLTLLFLLARDMTRRAANSNNGHHVGVRYVVVLFPRHVIWYGIRERAADRTQTRQRRPESPRGVA